MEPLGVSFSLQIEDQGLDEFDLSAILDPFDSNQFMLCLCPWAMSFFQKLCPGPFPPVSCSFPEPLTGHSIKENKLSSCCKSLTREEHRSGECLAVA